MQASIKLPMEGSVCSLMMMINVSRGARHGWMGAGAATLRIMQSVISVMEVRLLCRKNRHFRLVIRS
jgi:hypothetical protein